MLKNTHAHRHTITCMHEYFISTVTRSWSVISAWDKVWREESQDRNGPGRLGSKKAWSVAVVRAS